MLLQSDRLDLIPLTPPVLRSLLADEQTGASRLLDARFPAGFPDTADVIRLRLRQIETDPSVQPWLLRVILLRSSREVIGHIGFHTAPDPEYLREIAPGAVEFGFTVFPAWRRQGFAREASLTMMRHAEEVHGVNRFILTIQPSNLPSQALAAGLGFRKIGSHIDEVDGEEDILERRIHPASPLATDFITQPE